MIPLLPSLIFVSGLHLEVPEDPGFLGGAFLELRWEGLPNAHLGGRLGWKGGVDDTNPEALRLAQRAEALALLGFNFDLDGFLVRGDLLSGISRVEGWPFGALPPRAQFSPTLGFSLGGAIPLGEAWGHPIALDLAIGNVFFRVRDEWITAPTAALGLAGWLSDD